MNQLKRYFVIPVLAASLAGCALFYKTDEPRQHAEPTPKAIERVYQSEGPHAIQYLDIFGDWLDGNMKRPRSMGGTRFISLL